jgi:peptide/nickel transport system permease protein
MENRNVEAGGRSSLYSRALRRFFRNKISLVGLAIVLLLVFVAAFCPYLAPYDPKKQFWGDEWARPSSKFILGTDDLGRDVFSRVLWGARTSLTVGLFSVAIITVLGVFLGSIAGYFGGVVDQIIMRVTDIILTIPTLILLLLISSILRTRSLTIIMGVIGLLGWPAMARIVRSQYLSFKEQTFVEAAKTIGTPDMGIIFKHILPNALSPIIVVATLRIATAILTEASLSFLGFGDPTAITWGLMLHRGHIAVRSAPWVAIVPGLAIFITVIGLNLLGDALRDALDVRL